MNMTLLKALEAFMKKVCLLLLLLAAASLVACSDASEDSATEEPDDIIPDLPTVTEPPAESEPVDGDDGQDGYPEPGEQGYPIPATLTPFPDDYPAPPTIETFDPYPGGYAIMISPSGLQCDEPRYPDMDAAVAGLEEAGVTVHDISRLELMVCEACNCPTSLHFRVLIDPEDMTAAQSLGWYRSYE